MGTDRETNHKAKIIAVANIKGGVTKTSSVSNIGAGLHKQGYKVLLIDCDPQTNLTSCFFSDDLVEEPIKITPDMTEEERLEAEAINLDRSRNLYNVLSKDIRMPLRDTIRSIDDGFDIVIGSYELCSADVEFVRYVNGHALLQKIIKKEGLANDYDFILLDTSPSIGFMTLNALMAADYIIAPMFADSFSVKAIRLLNKSIVDIREAEERKLPVLGILLSRYHENFTLTKEIQSKIQECADILGTKLFDTKINDTTIVAKSQVAKKSLFDYKPKAEVTKRYVKIIEEIKERIGD